MVILMFCECKINHFFWNDKIESLLFFMCLHAFPFLLPPFSIFIFQISCKPNAIKLLKLLRCSRYSNVV